MEPGPEPAAPSPDPDASRPGAPRPDAPAPGGPAPEAIRPTQDERLLAMLAHLGGVVAAFVPSLVVWLVKRERGGFVEDQAREALNFQITVLVAAAVSAALVLCGIGAVLGTLVVVANVVLCALAAYRAYGGERYRYPLTLRLLR